jgi:hypothetical protein
MAPLQQAISCVSKAVLRPTGYEPSAVAHMLSSEQKPCALPKTDLWFDVGQWFYIIEDPVNGPSRVTTAGYQYTIETDDGEEILGYHWRPDSPSPFKEPHLHLGQGARIGRAEFEAAKLIFQRGAFQWRILSSSRLKSLRPSRGKTGRTCLELRQSGFGSMPRGAVSREAGTERLPSASSRLRHTPILRKFSLARSAVASASSAASSTSIQKHFINGDAFHSGGSSLA